MKKQHVSAILSAASIAAASAVLGLLPAHAAADTIWTNTSGDGLWNNGANWTNGTGTGGVPGPTDNVDISTTDGSPAASTVTFNLTYGGGTTYTTTGELTIGSGETLATPSGAYSEAPITLGTSTTVGLNNSGTIDFAGSTGHYWTISLPQGGASPASANSGLIESTGGGVLALGGNYGSGINNAGGTIATSGGSTIAWSSSYAGGAYSGEGPKITGGYVINGSGATMTNGGASNNRVVFSGVTFNNAGTLSITASPGGGGQLGAFNGYSGTTITNTGTATITYSGGAISGGSAYIVGAYGFAAVGPTATPGTDTSSLINSGAINISDTSSETTATSTSFAQLDLNASGGVTNNGTITFQATSSQGETSSINLGQNASIDGTGLFQFSGANNYIETMYSLSTSSHPTLTIGSSQTFSGAFHIGAQSNTTGYAPIVVVNNGTLHATDPSNPVYISTYNGNSFTNNGTLSVDNKAEIFDSDTSLTFTGGNFTVQINSDEVVGTTGSTGVLDVVGGLTLSSGSGTTLTVTDADPTVLPAGDVFTIVTAGSPISTFFSGYGEGSYYSLDGNTFQVNYNDDAVTLTSVLVPEPGTFALLALGGLGLLKRRRRPIRELDSSSPWTRG